MKDIVKRSWVEISLNQIKRNYQIYKDNIPDNKQIMAVVKADAYGHGDVEVAQALSKIGVNNWAVSNIDEACRLRMAGIVGQILVLGYTPFEQAQRLFDYDITQTILSVEYAELMSNSGYKIKVQFAIDTGMNRIGIDADNPGECATIIRRYKDNFELTGLFTHLCVADTYNPESVEFTNMQIKKFEAVASLISDLELPYIHCLNSAGGIWYNSDMSCLVRLGIVLYGLKPDYTNIIPEGIKPALEWKSVISMIKLVHIGETIGYGRTYTATREMKVATIPTGYADGYNRLLSNRGYVLLHGKKASIVGRVCMDQFMVDVTDIPEAKAYDEVVLIGQCQGEIFSADDMAEMIDTIGYEIVCNISKRVPRIYIEKDENIL